MTSEVNGTVAIYNVRNFGASGKKEEDAQAAIQQAIDTCARGGGGMVYFPPGEYTTGTLHLRSHVRLFVEAGATIFSSKDPDSFDKRALLYGEDLENISIEGRGTVDGQGEYEWHLMGDFRDWYIYPNQVQAEQAGVPLMRSFPTGNSVGHLVLLIRCKDVRITGLSFLRSPSWTMHLWGCERLVIDSIYIRTSLRDGVWADGIDPDGCKDVRISNCTIETGDDALVFYSSSIYGPALPCENITVTNCRLSSASSAIKFCDGNMNAIRNVTIDNCAITSSNRGIAFMVFDGGVVENVVLSNLTVECERFDWFWWGDGDPLHFNLIKRSEIDANIDKTKEPAIGVIRNVIISNVIAKGQGSCLIHGHVDSPLENITLENVRLAIAHNAQAHPRKSVNAVTIENVRNFRLKDFEIVWDAPYSKQWQSAMLVQNAKNLTLEGVSARQAPNDTEEAAIVFNDVDGGLVTGCRAQEGTGTMFQFTGDKTQDVVLWGNDYRQARVPAEVASDVEYGAVHEGW